MATSEIALTEVPRAITRLSVGRRAAEQRELRRGMEAVMRSLAYVDLDREVLLVAGQLREAYLRALDAIHVATALTVSDDIDAFVTYDDRQFSAAEAGGLNPVAPGSEQPHLRRSD